MIICKKRILEEKDIERLFKKFKRKVFCERFVFATMAVIGSIVTIFYLTSTPDLPLWVKGMMLALILVSSIAAPKIYSLAFKQLHNKEYINSNYSVKRGVINYRLRRNSNSDGINTRYTCYLSGMVLRTRIMPGRKALIRINGDMVDVYFIKDKDIAFLIHVLP